MAKKDHFHQLWKYPLDDMRRQIDPTQWALWLADIPEDLLAVKARPIIMRGIGAASYGKITVAINYAAKIEPCTAALIKLRMVRAKQATQERQCGTEGLHVCDGQADFNQGQDGHPVQCLIRRQGRA